MTLAAQLREMLDIGGMHTAQTELFRDKKKMKDALDAAGLRTPRNTTATGSEAIRAAATAIGFPLVIKPIAGAGSAHTHEVRDQATLSRHRRCRRAPRGQRRGIHRGRGIHLRHGLREWPHPLREHRLVPPQADHRPQRRVDLHADGQPAQSRPSGTCGRA